jgi:four helix bundle protein
MSPIAQKFDLEERTAQFCEEIIKLCKTVPLNDITRSIVSQLIRSATSIGANYMEATGASSKKDFRNKIYICKKESRERKHWLRMLSSASLAHKENALVLWQEAHEFVLIFQKITSTLDH